MTTDTEPPSAPGGKRARTRAALAAAALEVVAERGFAGASLDEIAARAGMTKGAIYSNFRSKAELLMTAVQTRGLSLTTRLPPDASLRERLDEMGDSLVELVSRARRDARFLMEFQLYALGEPELREEIAKMYAEVFTGGGDFLGRTRDLKPGVSPRHLAVTIQALALGLAIQAMMSPDEVTPEAIKAAMRGLADGVVAHP